MKITAIICEFNPLHSGHKRIIDYAKTFSDKVICIMSGNFTQRGLPAVADKFSRAKHAVLAGADLVVELPTVFATSSAENFAFGGVKIAQKMHADCLLFGSECANIEQLTQCADLLCEKEINDKIKAAMKSGVSYPKAVSLATQTDVLDSPNNVLAIEYIKAIKQLNAKITPATIRRENNYNSVSAQEYASSSALRQDAKLRAKYTFDYVTSDINDEIENAFCRYAPVALSTVSQRNFANIEGVSEGIENRFISADKTDYETMLTQVKTKRFTRAKLQRIVLAAVLNITKNDMSNAKDNDVPVLPLAVNSCSVALLKLTDNNVDDITARADNLYAALGGKAPPKKLIKL